MLGSSLSPYIVHNCYLGVSLQLALLLSSLIAMVKVHSIEISPPLLNSSCAWASEFAQLRELYNSLFTGAITTRTATLDGFKEDQRHRVRSGSV